MLVAAVVLQAAQAVFAPPLGVPLRVVTERSESGQRQYRMERIVRFMREGTGYRAEATLVTSGSQTRDASGALYEAGFAAFADRTIVMHLDASGGVVAIDDLERIWEAFCARVAQSAAAQRTLPPAARTALEARIVAPLRALPEERRRALIGSLVTAVIGSDAIEPPGTHAIQMPGESPFGTRLTLKGTRSVQAREALLEIETVASGEMTMPAQPSAPERRGRVEVRVDRRVDTRSGLVERLDERNVTQLEGGSKPRTIERTTTMHVTPDISAP